MNLDDESENIYWYSYRWDVTVWREGSSTMAAATTVHTAATFPSGATSFSPKPTVGAGRSPSATSVCSSSAEHDPAPWSGWPPDPGSTCPSPADHCPAHHWDQPHGSTTNDTGTTATELSQPHTDDNLTDTATDPTTATASTTTTAATTGVLLFLLYCFWLMRSHFCLLYLEKALKDILGIWFVS